MDPMRNNSSEVAGREAIYQSMKSGKSNWTSAFAIFREEAAQSVGDLAEVYWSSTAFYNLDEYAFIRYSSVDKQSGDRKFTASIKKIIPTHTDYLMQRLAQRAVGTRDSQMPTDIAAFLKKKCGEMNAKFNSKKLEDFLTKVAAGTMKSAEEKKSKKNATSQVADNSASIAEGRKIIYQSIKNDKQVALAWEKAISIFQKAAQESARLLQKVNDYKQTSYDFDSHAFILTLSLGLYELKHCSQFSPSDTVDVKKIIPDHTQYLLKQLAKNALQIEESWMLLEIQDKEKLNNVASFLKKKLGQENETFRSETLDKFLSKVVAGTVKSVEEKALRKCSDKHS